MKHKHLNPAIKTLLERYDVDGLYDVVLNREDKLICYGIVSDLGDIQLEVLVGSLAFIGFADEPSISMTTLLEHLDLDNAYADVGGRQEYYDSIVGTILDFETDTNITFPIKTSKDRCWIRLTTFCVNAPQKIYAFHFTVVTPFIQSEEELFHKTHYDSLTNVFNKYTLDFHYGARYQKPNFHVLYLDLDDFKELNDKLGHHKGNDYLRAFGKILASHEHDYNRFYRLGGDEFVGLFFEPTENILQIADEIIKQTVQLTDDIDDVTTSVSMGILKATIREDTIPKADRLMYRAKKLGKNRYMFEEES